MSYVPNSREAIMGAIAEAEAARMIQRRGIPVLPAYTLLENTDVATAPMVMLATEGYAIAPDLLCLAPGMPVWVDVKGKAVATWRRTMRRWEHGIDFANFVEYERVSKQTAIPMWLLVRESQAPIDPYADSRMVDRVEWLTIALEEARAIGEHRHDWPGGAARPKDRGRRGLGGFLWPRRSMKLWAQGKAAPLTATSLADCGPTNGEQLRLL